MKPVVVQSLNDEGGDRCVDILRLAAGFAWVECRRDPEDGHGWRSLPPRRDGFVTEHAALRDARATVGWLGA